MTPGLDKGLCMAIRAAREFQAKLDASVADARGKKEEAELTRIANEIREKIRDFKGIIRFSGCGVAVALSEDEL